MINKTNTNDLSTSGSNIQKIADGTDSGSAALCFSWLPPRAVALVADAEVVRHGMPAFRFESFHIELSEDGSQATIHLTTLAPNRQLVTEASSVPFSTTLLADLVSQVQSSAEADDDDLDEDDQEDEEDEEEDEEELDPSASLEGEREFGRAHLPALLADAQRRLREVVSRIQLLGLGDELLRG